MNFERAFQAMGSGKAIARPNWKSIVYLFLERGVVWALYVNGAVRCFSYFAPSLQEATDWFIVKVDELPDAPKPSSFKPSNASREYFSSARLAKKQERMRTAKWIKIRTKAQSTQP